MLNGEILNNNENNEKVQYSTLIKEEEIQEGKDDNVECKIFDEVDSVSLDESDENDDDVNKISKKIVFLEILL